MNDRSDLGSIMPFAAMIGVELIEMAPTRVIGRLDWATELCTTGAALHGGALMTLADALGAICAFSNLRPGNGTTTIESKTNFLRAVTRGDITGTARPLHVGRRFIVVETDVVNNQGKLVSRTTQTQAVLTPEAG